MKETRIMNTYFVVLKEPLKGYCLRVVAPDSDIVFTWAHKRLFSLFECIVNNKPRALMIGQTVYLNDEGDETHECN